MYYYQSNPFTVCEIGHWWNVVKSYTDVFTNELHTFWYGVQEFFSDRPLQCKQLYQFSFCVKHNTHGDNIVGA